MILIAPKKVDTSDYINILPSISKTFNKNSVCYYSNIFSELEALDGKLVISGRFFSPGFTLGMIPTLGMNEIERYLEEASGPFLAILMTENYARVFCSLYRHIDIFYVNTEFGTIFTSEIEICFKIINFDGRFNSSYIYNFVSGQQTYGCDTVFEGISRIQLGALVSCENLLQTGSNIPKQNYGKDIILNIMECISNIINPSDNIVLHFSGGLDSTVLLFCLKSIEVDFRTVHLVALEDYGATELENAHSVANDMDITLVVEETGGAPQRPMITPKNKPTDPLDANIYDLFAKIECGNLDINEYTENIQEKKLYLSGFGGDAVFVQSPSEDVILDVLLADGFKAALTYGTDLCYLKGLSFYHLFARNLQNLTCLTTISSRPKLPSWLPPKKIADCDNHFLYNSVERRSAKKKHIDDILQSLYCAGYAKEGLISSISFLLMQNVIASMLNVPVQDTFTSRFDRIHLRQSLYDHSNKCVAWKTQKRPSTNLAFAFMQANRSQLKKVLCDGLTKNYLNIDVKKLEKQIDWNSSVGINEDFQYIIRLIQIETVIKRNLLR